MNRADVYNSAREFLARVRPTTNAPTSIDQFKRRIGVLPYAVLEITPGAAGLLSGPADEQDTSTEGPRADICAYYSNAAIVNATCGVLEIIEGSINCEPPYITVPSGIPTFDAFDMRCTIRSDWTCVHVTTQVFEGFGALGSVGVWARGTTKLDSIFALVDHSNVTLYDQNVLIAFAPITFVEGGMLELLCDGASVNVRYAGAGVLSHTTTTLGGGNVGVAGATKGHHQTLSIYDCRCDSV